MRTQAKTIAFGGMMAALAVVIMSLGTIIPLATYVCPVICMLVERFVIMSCGKRIGWAWYGAVALLCLMLAPDKEAAAVFAFLGYYPIVKPRLDKMKLGFFAKLLLFNVSVLVMYWLLIHLFGMAQVAAEFRELGVAMTAVTLVLGNVTFFVLDVALGRKFGRKRG